MNTTAIATWSGFAPLIRAGRGGITHPDLTAAYGPGAALSITCEITKLGGSQQDPSFSVTGEVVTTESRRHRDVQACGCLHDEALHYWPECAPLVALHLAHATDGAPMYAEENGWYVLAGVLGGMGERYHAGNSDAQHGYSPPPREVLLQRFADHCRMSLDEARSVVERLDQETEKTQHGACEHCAGARLTMAGLPCPVCKGSGVESLPHFTRRRWREECDDMRPRWAREAHAGLLWMWEHATPSDLVNEWHARVLLWLGVDLPPKK